MTPGKVFTMSIISITGFSVIQYHLTFKIFLSAAALKKAAAALVSR
jgi:hypothetical protein